MISIGANGQRISYGIKHYNVDTKAELDALVLTLEVMGTTAFVIETSKYYMLNGNKQLIEIEPFGTGNSGSGGGSDTPIKHVVYDGGVIQG